jgi:hypothetical protein
VSEGEKTCYLYDEGKKRTELLKKIEEYEGEIEYERVKKHPLINLSVGENGTTWNIFILDKIEALEKKVEELTRVIEEIENSVNGKYVYSGEDLKEHPEVGKIKAEWGCTEPVRFLIPETEGRVRFTYTMDDDVVD